MLKAIFLFFIDAHRKQLILVFLSHEFMSVYDLRHFWQYNELLHHEEGH